MLIEPHETDFQSKGFQVHIIMRADTERLKCLSVIAEEYGYEIKNDLEKWSVIIYEPMHPPKISQRGRA
jgi:hypothetical protein